VIENQVPEIILTRLTIAQEHNEFIGQEEGVRIQEEDEEEDAIIQEEDEKNVKIQKEDDNESKNEEEYYSTSEQVFF
jgi:hypothetical protein